MGKSYFICKAIKFYTEEFNTTNQLQLVEPDGTSLLEGEPRTQLTPNSNEYLQNFHTFDCYHETKEKVLGRVFGREFAYYLKPHKFYTFCNLEQELAFLRLNTDSSEEVIKTLNEQKIYKLSKINVDFSKIITKVPEISGMWLKIYNSLNLDSAAYFGKDVDRDPRVREMIEKREVSYVQMKYVKDLQEHTIGISKRGSITLYNSYQDIETELDIAIDIYKKLLA
ncbi:hypothetical protein [Bacillus mycoides]|uniref:hypothetical protein n=1 Tax=Bacillus mycoides TaxID=1405 RepID=UPI0024BDB5DA|nr:hypothetical protein [Bacillus mycoides]